jgi:multidrug resistance efflux pump
VKKTLIVAAAALAVGGFYFLRARAHELVLTGIVTTDDVLVSPLVTGELEKLTVKEGDVVTRGQLLAVLSPAELRADRAFFDFSAKGYSDQIQEGEAALRYQTRQTEQQVRQAEASLAAVVAQQTEAVANLQNADANLRRVQSLVDRGSATAQEIDQARTTAQVAKARVDAVGKQMEAQRAAVSLAQTSGEQISARKSALGVVKQQQAAAAAQAEKASVRLGYSEVHAPVSGVVDVRAARQGEVVSAGQPILSLIDPDDLWVRVDVEESYVSRIRTGDRLRVRLPSDEVREGTVFYRGVDAGFATQRDVSRTKRDIKTFEIRLRVDNRDRRLAVGMTAYVLLPVGG